MLIKANLQSAISALPRGLQTRFAPSPTGYLHLGHVFSAIMTFGPAWVSGSHCLLRIEDHDQGRARQKYIDAILEDLEWLGFVDSRTKLSIQSQHDDRFAQAFRKLQAKGLLYPCTCTRKQITAKMKSRKPGQELRYPGTCRSQSIDLNQPHGWRILVPEHKEFSFNDLFLGLQTQIPSQQCGDFLIKDRDGYWTYQFAVVVDDIWENINLTIRGEDLFPSTARQIYLKELLGEPGPSLYLHHPLLVDSGGKKLSKRFLSTSIRDQRHSGRSKEEILGEACFLGGLIPSLRPVSLDEIKEEFRNV